MVLTEPPCDTLKKMTLRKVQVCESNQPYHQMYVASDTVPNGMYVITVPMPGDEPEDWICSCRGWQFRGKCKHLAKVYPCRWTEYDGPETQDETQRLSHTCPRCGGPTSEELALDE